MPIITAEITSLKAHPNALKLKICETTDGQKIYSIVCGAQNAQVGMKTILATLGSTLPDGKKIELASLRGVESYGMLCSPKDLCISNETGLIDLREETPLGVDFSKLDKNLLSSTPWYRYKLVESIYEIKNDVEEDNGKTFLITVPKDSPPPSHATLKSQTYWHDGQYLYRNFSITA